MSFTRVTATAVGVAALPLLSILGGPATAPASASAASGGGSGDGRLTVSVDDGQGHVTTYRLVCGPGGAAEGSHPDSRKACDRLERIGGPLGPVETGQMCSMIYGGPSTASVTGTWRSAVVRDHYSLANGCEIGRWEQMEPVLPGGPGKA